MPIPRPVAHPSEDGSLELLLETLLSAREDVRRLRRTPNDQRGLHAAQQSLLVAMESYAAALTEQGLPMPWRLRDDLRLQRSIGSHRDSLGARGYRGSRSV
jgi:hypothetical protein